jgi:hypothetical protein
MDVGGIEPSVAGIPARQLAHVMDYTGIEPALQPFRPKLQLFHHDVTASPAFRLYFKYQNHQNGIRTHDADQQY